MGYFTLERQSVILVNFVNLYGIYIYRYSKISKIIIIKSSVQLQLVTVGAQETILKQSIYITVCLRLCCLSSVLLHSSLFFMGPLL